MNKASRPMQDRQLIKLSVKAKLTGHIFACFIACIIPSALPWIMQLIPIQFGNINFLIADYMILQFSLPMLVLSFIATTFVTDPISVKVAGYFLSLNRNPDNLPSPLTVCDCFGPYYGQLVRGMFQRSLRIWLWSIVPIIIGILIPGTWEMAEVSGLEVIRINDSMYLFLLAGLILNLYRSLGYMMVPYLLADWPWLKAKQALEESIDLTRGRLWELFVLQLSFIGWLFLVSITLFIGAIYAYPYIEGTIAAYYIGFSKPMPWDERRELHDAA